MTRIPWDQDVDWRSVLVAGPTARPVDPAYIRSRVLRAADDGVEDDLIDAYIAAAVEIAEHDTGRCLMPQTWQVRLSAFPDGPIYLPKLPVIEVTAFEYLDSAGDLQSLAVSPAEFELRPSGEWTRASVVPLAGDSWPATWETGDAVRITYRAGYDRPELIPPTLLAGVGLLVGELYTNRVLSVGDLVGKSVLQLDRFFKPVP